MLPHATTKSTYINPPPPPSPKTHIHKLNLFIQKKKPKKEKKFFKSLLLNMASSLSRKLISIAFLALFLFSCEVNAVRPGRMTMTATAKATTAEKMMKEDEVSAVMALKYFQEKEGKLFFARLPKGVPIPPSAPSKRHNSAPLNR